MAELLYLYTEYVEDAVVLTALIVDDDGNCYETELN